LFLLTVMEFENKDIIFSHKLFMLY
ncbi:hypothetical protein A5868_001049, partial [Enterococcus sp. 12F9_DIV0723]